MGLTAGTRIGPYEVIAQIGVGGMGEVYKATDTNLKRAVAIKVLPAAVAADPDRLARFQREAEVLASLNHPNIAQIHGLERSDGVTALVMELVEGPTLADRITQGAIPLDEALTFAKQMAEALEAAHERGIIHRDLKPANVKVRPDGTVKVLDFGLAKAMDSSGAMSANASMSPTITTPAMTQAGMILGTAAYMSPEQARGKTVDKRADLWAFGCVLFEMLTGQRPFEGDDVAVTLGAVIHKEPDWRALPANTPASIRRLLIRCLTKDPKGRIADASTARLEIVDATTTAGIEAPVRPALARQSAWRRMAPVAAAVAVTAVATGLGTWALTRPPAPRPVHLTLSHPAPDVVGGNINDANMALSPDGRHVAYVTSTPLVGGSNTLPLYVRALDETEPRLVSTGGRSPFFSPDGQWVGFVEGNRRLSKVAVTGGPSVSISADFGARFFGASWGPDDAIVYSTGEISKGLQRVSAVGGSSEVLTTPDQAKGETAHVYPEVLPGGRAVLFTIQTSQGTDRSQIAVLDLASRAYRVVVQGGTHARYSASGHIVYGVSGTLRAVAFDVARLEAHGTPVPVLDGVDTKATGAVSFGLSPDGTLAYLTGTGRAQRALEWLDRMGRDQPLGVQAPAGLSQFDDPVLSPDGTQVAVTIGQDTTEADLWIWSLTRQVLTRLTFEPGTQRNAVWTRDGKKVAYQSGTSGVFWRNADGTGNAEALVPTGTDGGNLRPYSWSGDGHLFFYDSRGLGSVAVMSSQGDRTPMKLLEGKGVDPRPVVSPDGRWIAYQSMESGRPEIYVRPFPAVDSGKWQLSTGRMPTGSSPRWIANGRTLVFADGDGLMEVTVETSPTFRPSSPRRVLTWPTGVTSDFDVSPDGTRFLVVREVGDTTRAQLNVVLNWTEELKRLVPGN